MRVKIIFDDYNKQAYDGKKLLVVLENPLFRETAVRKQKFVRKIFMIISVVCDLKIMPDAKNYSPCLDKWALSWFLRAFDGSKSALKRLLSGFKKLLNGSCTALKRLLSRS